MNHPLEAETGTGPVQLTESERHQLLGDERRRVTLDALRRVNAPITLDELAEIVAQRESGEMIPTDEAKTLVAITLHHVHLPKLTDCRVIDYDPETMRVETCRSLPPR